MKLKEYKIFTNSVTPLTNNTIKEANEENNIQSISYSNRLANIRKSYPLIYFIGWKSKDKINEWR